MAITGPIKIDSDEAFPHGLGIVGPVTPLGDFDASTIAWTTHDNECCSR